MIYNIKEYKFIFDTPAKRQQELAIVSKMMELLNRNKYDNIEEFIAKNTSYQNFAKNNNLENVLKHFGNTLVEEDFKIIMDNIKSLTNDKRNFEKDNIKSTKIDNHEYNSFKGDKTYFIDNSNSNKTIEEQMKQLQTQNELFQTSDIKQNSENMFKELEKSKKESINPIYITEINKGNLNEEEEKILEAAIGYQIQTGKVIKIDIKKQVIVDELDNIMRIEKKDEQFTIIDGDAKENSEEKENQKTEKSSSYTKQLVYASNNNKN